jgi:hypothetical protein
VSIAQRKKILVFEPTFNSYNNTLLDMYNMMIAAVRNLPRLETELYVDWGGQQVVLKVCFICYYGFSLYDLAITYVILLCSNCNKYGARGSVVVKALCYKREGHGFET